MHELFVLFSLLIILGMTCKFYVMEDLYKKQDKNES